MELLQGIDTIIIRVSNIDESKKWYTEKLGLKNVYEDPIHKLVVLDTFSLITLTIWETSENINSNPHKASYPIFRSADAKKAHAELKRSDVVVEDLVTDHAVTYFMFRDPDNNVLEVCQVHS